MALVSPFATVSHSSFACSNPVECFLSSVFDLQSALTVEAREKESALFTGRERFIPGLMVCNKGHLSISSSLLVKKNPNDHECCMSEHSHSDDKI
jgi:hypothetical protein